MLFLYSVVVPDSSLNIQAWKMAGVCGGLWKDDIDLKIALEDLVKKGYKRSEILVTVRKDFPQYIWGCVKTLDRRLRHFSINYIEYDTPLETVQDAIAQELEGPGSLLGVRAMTKKLRMHHDIKVPRNLVNAAMYDADPEGLEDRRPANRKKKRDGKFVTMGVNWTWSLDGHDKLMGFQNWTFPLAIYGCYDTASRKVMFVKVWKSNSDPNLVGRWYFDHLYTSQRISSKLRIDRGTETGLLATLHVFLRRNHGDMAPEDTVEYGSSTSNRIERWWRELHERLGKFFKFQLQQLLEQGFYDREDENDRKILAYVFIPIVQREIDLFVELWNNSRTRLQRNTLMPDGIPNVIYNSPEQYGLEDKGWNLCREELAEAAEASGVLNVLDDYVDEAFRTECSRHLPDVESVLAKDAARKYMELRSKIKE